MAAIVRQARILTKSGLKKVVVVVTPRIKRTKKPYQNHNNLNEMGEIKMDLLLVCIEFALVRLVYKFSAVAVV